MNLEMPADLLPHALAVVQIDDRAGQQALGRDRRERPVP